MFNWGLVKLAAIMLILSGCALGSGAATGPDGKVAIPKAKTPTFVALSTGKCHFGRNTADPEFLLALTPVAGVLLEAVGKPLVEKGVEYVADYLDQRARELTSSSTAKLNSQIYKTQDSKGVKQVVLEEHRCIYIVRGGRKESSNAGKVKGFSKSDIEQLKSFLGFEIKSTPELYMEFEIDYENAEVPAQTVKVPVSAKKTEEVKVESREVTTHLGVRPVYLAYNKAGPKRSDEDGKQIVVEIALSTIGLSPADKPKTILKTTTDFGVVSLGKVLEVSDLSDRELEFSPLPTVRAVEVDIPVVLSNGQPRIAKAVMFDPVFFGLSVAVTETEDGGDIERAIAEQLRSKKSDVSKPIVDALKGLLPESPKAAK